MASVETAEDRSNSGIDWEPRLKLTRTTAYEPRGVPPIVRMSRIVPVLLDLGV